MDYNITNIEMGINTGQISQQTRNQCFTRINILTIIVMMMLQFTLSMIIEQRGNILIRVFGTLMLFSYFSYVGMRLSKPNYRIQYIQPNIIHNTNSRLGFSFNEGGEVKYVQISKTNSVGIGQSLTNFLMLLVSNIKIIAPLIIFSTLIAYILENCLQILEAKQTKIAIQIINKIYSKMEAEGIDAETYGQQYVGLFAANYINVIPQETVKKMLKLTLQVGGLNLLLYIFHFLQTWVTFICFDFCLKRKQGTPDQQQKRLTFSNIFSILWNRFIKLNVIAAQLRLSLRLIVVFILYVTLAPYYYISLAFMYRKVMDPDHKLQAITAAFLRLKAQQTQTKFKQQTSSQNNSNIQANAQPSENRQQLKGDAQQHVNPSPELNSNENKNTNQIPNENKNYNIEMITLRIENENQRTRKIELKKFDTLASSISRNKIQASIPPQIHQNIMGNIDTLNENIVKQKLYSDYRHYKKRPRTRVRKQKEYRPVYYKEREQHNQRKIRKFIYRCYPIQEIIQV